MPFRRRSKSIRKTLRASRAVCQHLESRTMLTAVVNGLFSQTNTIYDGTNTFIFRQANGDDNIKISVTGNITAEFIGARAPMSFDELDLVNEDGMVLTDLLPDTAAAFVAPALVNGVVVPASNISTFLFGIYIVSADLNSAISIAQVANRVTPPPTPPQVRPMQPFSAGQVMNIYNASTGARQNITPDDGGVYIGAQTLAAQLIQTPQIVPNPADTDLSTPLIWSNQRSFGMRPSTAGEMFAGIETAPGVDIGKIFIGGTVTGIVDIRGDINTFYAGTILTGDASGITALGFESDLNAQNIGHFPRNNFHVEGDLRNLVTANSLGTVSLTDVAAAGDFTSPNYKTGFQLDVSGRVGQVFANDSFLGRATVRNLATVPGPGTIQRELEFFNTGTFGGEGTYFDPDFMGIDIAIGAATLDARFQNNTFDTAQWLGAARSSQLNNANVIDLRGSLGNFTPSGPGGGFDPIDFYALPLLAGQTVDIQLTDTLANLVDTRHARLGIFDPRGRLIASDYSNVDLFRSNGTFSRVNKAIRITADIPGSYRIAISNSGDFNFNGAVDDGESVTSRFPNNYELRITNPGDIAFGGLIVNQHIGTLDVDNKGIEVLRGDMGEIRAGLGVAGQGQGQIVSLSSVWYVPGGHFRAMEAFSIGNSGALLVLGTGPDLLVRKGSIGLLRTTSTALTNTLVMNDDYFLTDGITPLFPRAVDDLSKTPAYLAAGQDIQVIDCAGVLEGTYLANRRIGVIRTQQLGGLLLDLQQGSIFTTSAPVIQANVDTIGSDGVIDLIDVTAVGAAGGLTVTAFRPAISVGPNGNLRYFHLGANATAAPDEFFGIPTPMQETYDPGEKVTITDDSGAKVTLTPIPRDPMTLFPLPTNRLSDFLDPPSLNVLTYPIRGTSGFAIIRVSTSQVDDPGSDGVTNIVRPGGGGVLVEVGAGGRPAEIAELNLTLTPAASTSNPFTFNPFLGTDAGIPGRTYQQNEPPVAPAQPIRPLNIIMRGSGPIDVYDIVATGAQIINSIDNQTTGEIVNITGAPDIFTFNAQTIGVPKRSTGAAVEGGLVRLAAPAQGQPFLDTRTLVNVGDVNLMSARGAVGNVQAVNIGTVQANSDGRNTSGTFEGIAAPVVARGTANELIGNIVLARIGEGILPSGSGLLIKAGLYADGVIDQVTGNGDIRGDIVATVNSAFVTQQATDAEGNALLNPDGTPLQISTPFYGIGAIRLNGGSIIDADIMTTTFDNAGEGFASTFGFAFLEAPDSSTSPVYDIGPIRLEGGGGIIGSLFYAPDVGQIAINGGFGFVNSTIATISGGIVGGVVTDGFGVRDAFMAGASIGTVDARGKGGRVATSAYSGSVRQSETSAFDRYSGQGLDQFNDLHQYLGTSTRRPTVVGSSETGLIVDSEILATNNLGNVKAFRILGKDVIRLDPLTNRRTRINFGSTAYPMRINVGNITNNILVTDTTDGLSLTSGRLKNFSAGNDVIYTALNVGTSLDSFYAGAFRGTSSLKMTTQAGSVQNFRTKRSLYGSVVISRDIVNMTVGTDIGSPLIRASNNIRNLKVAGSVLTGASITAGKTLVNLNIGKDLQQGATIRAKAITKQSIGGQVLGDIIIA